MAKAQATAALEALKDEVVVPTHLVGKDEGYKVVAIKFESVRLLMIKIEEGREDPRRSEIIRSKEKKAQVAFVRGTTSEPSKDIGRLLKEAKELREEIVARKAPDMTLPTPLAKWLEVNKMECKWM